MKVSHGGELQRGGETPIERSGFYEHFL